MSDLDQRVADGLRELVGRAPVDADVWPAAERYVARHRRQRHAITGAVVVVALVVGGLGTAVAARGGASKVTVSEHGATTDTSSSEPRREMLTATGPSQGSFTITAQPAAPLAFGPSSVSVQTGIYSLTLRDGGNTTHTLYFDQSSTLWAGLVVNTQGQALKSRIFFPASGDYTFYCAVPGHRAAGMQGVVHVTGPTMTLAQAEAAAQPSGGSSVGVHSTPTGTGT
jgi:plastocyanin